MPNTGTKATEITVIDAANFAVAQQIMQDAARGLAPHSVTYEPSTQRLFVPNRDSTTVVALDVATNSIAGYVEVGQEPHYASLGLDGQLYTAVKHDNKVVVFNPQSLKILTEITDPAIVGPHHIVFTTGATHQPLPATGADIAITWLLSIGVIVLLGGMVLRHAGGSWPVRR